MREIVGGGVQIGNPRGGVGQCAGMSPEAGLAEEPEVPCDREDSESGGFVGCSCRCVPGVAACLDDRDVHSVATHVIDRQLRQLRADAASLVVGINADDLDPAHPFVERVQCDGNEGYWAIVHYGDEDVPLGVRATRSDSFGLALLPLGVQAEEDFVAEDAADGRENRFPGADRELDDRLEVFLLERADLDRAFGHVTTVTGR